MTGTEHKCENCGEPAQGRITSEWAGGTGAHRLCFRCAELERTLKYRHKAAFNLGAVFMVVGGLSLVISLFADQLAFGHSRGFGLRQIAGVIIGLVLFGVGGVMRIPTVMVIGPCAVFLSLLADLLKLGDSPGFGHKQILGCVLGGVLMTVGLLIVVLRNRWAARLQPPPGEDETAQVLVIGTIALSTLFGGS